MAPRAYFRLWGARDAGASPLWRDRSEGQRPRAAERPLLFLRALRDRDDEACRLAAARELLEIVLRLCGKEDGVEVLAARCLRDLRPRGIEPARVRLDLEDLAFENTPVEAERRLQLLSTRREYQRFAAPLGRSGKVCTESARRRAHARSGPSTRRSSGPPRARQRHALS